MSAKRNKRHQLRGRVVSENALGDIRRLLEGQDMSRHRLIELLHLIQDHFGQLPKPHLVALAREMKMSAAEVFEVASFYHHFHIVESAQVSTLLSVRVCQSITCELFSEKGWFESLRQALGDEVDLQQVPCVGRCADAPVVVVGQNPVTRATLEKVQRSVKEVEVNDPLPAGATRLAEYLAGGGYRSWQSCIDGKLDGQEILERLENSKLRGLGGAGFPVGRKWRIVKGQPAPRLMAVNIDEGEPGTFKDRFFLESDPHRFIEGMLIAAHVVAIDSITIYIRDEYTALRHLLLQEIASLKQHFSTQLPDIELRRGAGSYICGEESAMIESIEGKRGMPRLRPPFVAQVGLFGRPTLEHNMETLFWVRDIVELGSDWFSEQGRHGRYGLRSFSVSGRVNKPGVHIAPAGITLMELIDEYCGGMLDGHRLKAYFPGGASGGILPASLADVPLDFDTLQEYGCFIGSAAIIVLSDHDSVRDSALNAMKFFAEESCGQCTPCRVGTQKAVALMQHEVWDASLMQELAQTMQDASICGLGQAAPNPMLCALRFFPEEICPRETGNA